MLMCFIQPVVIFLLYIKYKIKVFLKYKRNFICITNLIYTVIYKLTEPKASTINDAEKNYIPLML